MLDDNRTPGDIFRSVVKGKNFITNKINYYKKIGRHIVEVSSGEFMGNILYGITTIENTAGIWRKSDLLSCCVHSVEELDEKIFEIENHDVLVAQRMARYIKDDE